MSDILQAAQSYKQLLDVEYQIVLGRKSKTLSLSIFFDENQFFHLAGLQYLEDIPDIFRSKREIIFEKILKGAITQKQLESSKFFPDIADRIKYLSFLETIMDSNKTIFKYNPQLEVFSSIMADFSLQLWLIFC